jgi:hypothetical protein
MRSSGALVKWGDILSPKRATATFKFPSYPPRPLGTATAVPVDEDLSPPCAKDTRALGPLGKRTPFAPSGALPPLASKGGDEGKGGTHLI